MDECVAKETRAGGLLSPLEDPSAPTELPAWHGCAWRIGQWTGAFLALGIALRLFRYLLPFPLWCDEYQLADNFLDRDFLGILQPLHNNQVAPPGFLGIELLNTRLFGFHEWSLRLFPCLCGLVSLVLMRRVAGRLLTGIPQVLAVAVLAVSYYPIRLGAEVKPYAGDLMCSLVILACVVEWQRDRRQTRWLWILAAAIGPMLTISFPSVFVGGAASLTVAALMLSDWRSGARPERGGILAYLGYNLALVGCFGAILAVNMSQQYHATANDMVRCWADSFPPLTNPRQLVTWLLDAHTGVIFAYPIGAENGGSVLTALGCLVGVWHLYKQGPRWVLVFGGSAFALTFIAAALHRYPYGGHARLAQHLAPVIVLSLATGVGALIQSLWRRELGVPLWRLACAGCLLVAVGTTARDLVTPRKSADDYRHQGFARWFWDSSNSTPTVCVEDDLGWKLYGHSLRTPYRCYRRIYQSAPLSVDAARTRVEQGREPIRCVVFHSVSAPRDDAAFAQWMEGMLVRYTLSQQCQHQLELVNSGNIAADFRTICYDVYDFTPRVTGPTPADPTGALAEAPLDRVRR